MTSSDFRGHSHVIFLAVTFCTSLQQLTRFQLRKHVALYLCDI